MRYGMTFIFRETKTNSWTATYLTIIAVRGCNLGSIKLCESQKEKLISAFKQDLRQISVKSRCQKILILLS